jgi:hypothetical protein
MSVHDVAMNPVGAGFLNAMDLIRELGEVGGEDGRRHDYFLHTKPKSNAQRPTSNAQFKLHFVIRHSDFGIGGQPIYIY